MHYKQQNVLDAIISTLNAKNVGSKELTQNILDLLNRNGPNSLLSLTFLKNEKLIRSQL